MKNYTFDVGGTGTKCIIFLDNKEIDTKYLTYSERPEGKGGLEHFQTPLILILNEISKILDLETDDFNLAISFPGIINLEKKRVLTESALSEVDVDIEGYFKKYKNLKIFKIANDAKIAAWGEFSERQKENKNLNSLIHLTIGTALGSGLIINKQIFYGNSSMAGEVSKMYSSLDKNNNDSVALDTGLGTLLIKYFLKTNQKVTGEEFFELYNSKNETALELMDDYTSHLAKFIINVDYLLDFDCITIGGGVSANDQFISLIREKLRLHKNNYVGEKLFFSNDNVEKKFDVSKLKNKAACYGLLSLLTEI